MPFSLLTFALVTVAMAIGDVCWTVYFIEVEKRRPIHAGAWSAAIVLMSTFTVRQYVSNPWYILAATLGAFLGTVGTVWVNRRKQVGGT